MKMTYASLSALHSALCALLQQGETLLESLTDEQYCEAHPEANSSGVGGHYRHTLDHFFPLLNPPENGLLDYDARIREKRLETDRPYALRITRSLRETAEQLDAEQFTREVQVKCSVSEHPVSPEVPSTLAREVMYAEIHAVHHYAIIRILCTLKGVDLPERFGVAPSTLNHQSATNR